MTQVPNEELPPHNLKIAELIEAIIKKTTLVIVLLTGKPEKGVRGECRKILQQLNIELEEIKKGLGLLVACDDPKPEGGR
jgi:hypothetical protein